ncbi:MAG: endonuclease III [Candidatus Diapherotrites archaeon]|jgi:endonuclease III|nr:endonuclease III [Candidatus Diapherotrites archaeon]MBT4597242.1 endonuclease III [Candidatus Diapherotrites archaeon]
MDNGAALRNDLKRKLRQLSELKKRSNRMRLAAENWDEEWKTLMAIILSAQSRDETTIRIAKALFEEYYSLDNLANARYWDVLKVLKSINYNRTKSKHIIACAKILVNIYGGKVPKRFGALLDLPGVGRKTANVFLSAIGQDSVGVDTHVFYISKKLGWSNSKNIKKVEFDLKKSFPKEYWNEINPALVRFGKTFTSKQEKDFILNKIKEL